MKGDSVTNLVKKPLASAWRLAEWSGWQESGALSRLRRGQRPGHVCLLGAWSGCRGWVVGQLWGWQEVGLHGRVGQTMDDLENCARDQPVSRGPVSYGTE